MALGNRNPARGRIGNEFTLPQGRGDRRRRLGQRKRN